MHLIAIVDYGMGNIESVMNAFDLLGTQCIVTNDSKKLAQSAGIVLPGVGAFHAAIQNLQKMELDAELYEQIIVKQKPFLGICLGMQLIAEDSTEQQLSKGFGWINGHVSKLEQHKSFPVPHVGWNEVVCRQDSTLFNKIEENAHFFFDHSYYLQCEPENIAATCDYGGTVVASVEKDNIFAVQFHPEKSQRNGLKLLRNFLNFTRAY